MKIILASIHYTLCTERQCSTMFLFNKIFSISSEMDKMKRKYWNRRVNLKQCTKPSIFYSSPNQKYICSLFSRSVSHFFICFFFFDLHYFDCFFSPSSPNLFIWHLTFEAKKEESKERKMIFHVHLPPIGLCVCVCVQRFSLLK